MFLDPISYLTLFFLHARKKKTLAEPIYTCWNILSSSGIGFLAWQEQGVLAPISQLVYPICFWMCLAMISNESFSSCQYCLEFSDNLSHKDVSADGKPACSLKSVWDQFFLSPERCEKCMMLLYTGLGEIAQKEGVWWRTYLKHENSNYFFRLFMWTA